MVLRVLEQKSGGLFGKLVSATLGLTWTLSTFLVVPMLVARDVGPIEAIKESAVLLKKTWGHNLAGTVGIGLAGGLVSMAIALVGGLVMLLAFSVAKPLGIAVGAVLLLALLAAGIYQAALTGVYQAALFVFADSGKLPPGFEKSQLEMAFESK